MVKLRIILTILILGGITLAGFWYLDNFVLGDKNESVSDNWLRRTSDDIQWIQDDLKRFNLAIFDKPLVLVYTPENAQSLREQSFLNQFKLAVNGGYFRGSYVSAEHAGMLIHKGELLFRNVPDSQLTHVVVYDSLTDEVEFIAEKLVTAEDYLNPRFTLFQSGPLLIENNRVRSDLIEKSLNGTARSLRAVLGITDAGKKFFLISRVNFTLQELADLILEIPEFKNAKVSAINLDGGTSTAMFSDSLDEFNFGESKRLPIVIGVN